MLFMVIFTSVLSSEYLLNLLLQAHLTLFLGKSQDNFNITTDDNLTSEESFINGTYFYEKSDNFDEYLTELGVGYFLRQLAALAYPILTVRR